jgi:NAD(P)-dependent dehydrogenase (short-subunit alcohol dehydrogenase family)
LGLVATAAGISSFAHASEYKEDQTREFEGRSAFVTGAARGIGYACAEALARGGANIVLFDIASQIKDVPYPLATAEDLANAKAAIEALDVKCIAVKGDVRDGDAQAAAMQRAVSEFGSLDFVVGNAGITQIGPLERFSEAELSVGRHRHHQKHGHGPGQTSRHLQRVVSDPGAHQTAGQRVYSVKFGSRPDPDV